MLAAFSLRSERTSIPAFAASAFLLLLMIPITVALVVNRDPWVDESMLLDSIVAMNLKDIAHPLPLYEQAAPIAYIVLAKTVLFFASGSEPLHIVLALRALAVAVGLIGVFFLTLLARNESSTAGALAVAALCLTSPAMIVSMTAVKHYIFDFTATAIIAYTAAGVARTGGTYDFVKFVAASFVACLLSFVAAIPIVACLSAAAFVRIVHAIQTRPRTELVSSPKASMIASDLSRFVSFGGIALLIAVAFYVVFSRSMTEVAIKAYPDTYDQQNITLSKSILENMLMLWRLPIFLIEFSAPHVPFGQRPPWGDILRLLVDAAVLGLIVVAFGFCVLRNLFVAAAFAIALALIVALNALNKLPFSSGRFLFFVAPLLFLVIGLGGVYGYRFATLRLAPTWNRLIQFGGGLLFVAFYGIGSAYLAAKLEVQAVSPLLSKIISDAPEAPVWVYYGAQPAMRFLTPKQIRQVGLFDPTSGSGLDRWDYRGGGTSENLRENNPRYPSTVEEALKGQTEAWLLFSNEWTHPIHKLFLEAAERSVGHCELSKTAIGSTLYFCSAATKN